MSDKKLEWRELFSLARIRFLNVILRLFLNPTLFSFNKHRLP